jgi:hypothetical protein
LFEKDKDPKEVNTTGIENDPLAVLLELSRTLAVKMKLPGVVGVPQAFPLEISSNREAMFLA